MTPHIFVIDDDASILEVTTIILEDSGYLVSAFSNSASLMQALATQAPDMILMDVWLGDTDGKTVSLELHNNEKTKHIPIVLFSALNQVEAITKQAHADGYLRKPFAMQELLTIVEKHAGKAL